MATKLGDLTVGVAADLHGLHRGMREAGRFIDRFQQDVVAKSRSIARDAIGFATGDLLAGGVRGMAGQVRDVVGESVRMAASWEKSAVTFEVMLGSAERARDLMKDLRDFAVESPLTLADSVNQATRLLAAGIAQDQIGPTLRVLSDLTMGDKEKFSRLSLAYSQVRSAGRLQGDELRQLQELGIALNEPLSRATGIPVNQLKDAVADGKVLFRDLQAAMKSMTSEGGQFFNMTKRGAMTTEGMFARLTDSVEELKREFGRAVIEEAGLNDALMDGSRFADSMKGTIDDLRPGIRFAADTLKSVAHIGAEVVRNGPLFARAFGEAFEIANPNAARLLGQVRGLVDAAKDFRLDPVMVVDVAVDMASAFGASFDSVIGRLGDGLADIHREHIKPITDSIKTAADAWRMISDPIKAANRTLEDMGFSEDQFRGRAMADPLLEATRIQLARIGHEFKNAPAGSEAATRAKEKYRDLNAAYHDVIGKTLEADLARQAVLLHEHGKKSAGDIGAARKDRDTLASDALTKRFDLEKALFGATGTPSQNLAKTLGLDGLRERVRTMAGDIGQRGLPTATKDLAAMAMLGAAGAFKAPIAPRAFTIDPPGAFDGGRSDGGVKLPTPMELGSQSLAELYSKLIGGSGPQNPIVSEMQKLNETQKLALDELRRGQQPAPAGPPVVSLPVR